MKEECRGCFLIRVLKDDPYYADNKINCEFQHLLCPCKTCLVKITCNMIDKMSTCQVSIDFSMQHATNEYWTKRRKEENA